MAEGERATGAPNTIYDLSSVLSHAPEGGACTIPIPTSRTPSGKATRGSAEFSAR